MGNIHTSGEDYLETILVLWNKQNGEVRSIDVARELNVTKPSVSNAMKILREGKFITMDENGFSARGASDLLLEICCGKDLRKASCIDRVACKSWC